MMQSVPYTYPLVLMGRSGQYRIGVVLFQEMYDAKIKQPEYLDNGRSLCRTEW